MKTKNKYICFLQTPPLPRRSLPLPPEGAGVSLPPSHPWGTPGWAHVFPEGGNPNSPPPSHRIVGGCSHSPPHPPPQPFPAPFYLCTTGCFHQWAANHNATEKIQKCSRRTANVVGPECRNAARTKCKTLSIWSGIQKCRCNCQCKGQRIQSITATHRNGYGEPWWTLHK